MHPFLYSRKIRKCNKDGVEYQDIKPIMNFISKEIHYNYKLEVNIKGAQCISS